MEKNTQTDIPFNNNKDDNVEEEIMMTDKP